MIFRILKPLISIAMLSVIVLTGCSAGNTQKSTDEPASQADQTESSSAYPIIIEHAFGETVIESRPQRIAAISWGNQDVPLALGVVPVGVSEANYGVTDGSGLLPWTAAGFKKSGVENPIIYKDAAGLDFEAVSDSQPDIILAAYSGITKEEYELLSQIAPVVAFKESAWQTFWRDQILMNSLGMGMKAEGENLVKELENLIEAKAADYPQIKGKKAAFFYFDEADLSKFYIYLAQDPRAAYLTDLGMPFPESVMKLSKDSNLFALEISAENADLINDLDIAVTYGSETLMKTLQSDPLIGTIPAIKHGAVAIIPEGTPLAASGTPSALSIPATIDEYLSIIGEAAGKVNE